MPIYSITISDKEDKVLKFWLENPQQWLENAFRNKIRQRIDASILEKTNFNPKKMNYDDKLIELEKIILPNKAERNRSDLLSS